MFNSEHLEQAFVASLPEITLLVSWLVLQIGFANYYANEFRQTYVHQGTIGFIFPNNHKPTYWDFIRFSIGIGLRIRAPRVQVANKKLRRLVLAQSLISFALNVFIVALGILIVMRKFD